MGTTTAPDPPESPFSPFEQVEEDDDRLLHRRKSTPLDPPEIPDEAGATATTTPCSQQDMYQPPHEPQATSGAGTTARTGRRDRPRQRGLEPTEFQIKEEHPTTQSSLTSNNSSTSIITKAAGAMVLYDAPSSPTPIGDNQMLALPMMEEPEPGMTTMTMATTIATNDEYIASPGGEEAVVADQQQLALVKTQDQLAQLKTDKLHRQNSKSTHRGQELVVKHNPPQPAAVTATENNQLALTKPQNLRRGFDHCFVNVPTKERLSVLFATLRRSADRKVVVICSSWESCKFHAVLFRQLEMLHVYELHEQIDDDGILGSGAPTKPGDGGGDVARAYNEFLYTYPGILFASDVSMNEFDIPPNVDYVIQYEPPMDPAGYVFRMSNAQIYETSCHVALLFLNPNELEFLGLFDKDVDIENKELEARKVSEFQGKAERLVAKHSKLNDLAWRAFRAYVIAYEAHSMSKIYDKTKMDEDVSVRKSFGQPHLPEYTSKYFVYNSKQPGEAVAISGGAEKKPTKEDGDNKKKKIDDKEKEHQRYYQKQPKQWTNEKSWRKEAVPWTTRDSKTWRHSHTKNTLGVSDSKNN